MEVIMEVDSDANVIGTRKAYKPGDIIDGNCQPLFKVLNFMSNERVKICDSCFQTPSADEKESKLKACGGCQLMTYCSKECQKADWKNGHKLECKSKTWAKNNFDTSDKNPIEIEVRFQLFRAMAFLSLNPEEATKLYTYNVRDLDLDPNGNTSAMSMCFNDILDLPDTIVSLQYDHVTSKLADEIRQEKLDTKEIVPDVKFFAKIMRIFQTNGFPLRTPNQGVLDTCPVGMAIFVQRSIFKHSCKPNAVFCRNGPKFEVRAIADIPEDQDLTISYLAYHPRWPLWEFNEILRREERQKILQERFGYQSECQCDCCRTIADATVDFKKLNSDIEFFKSCKDNKNYWGIYSVEEFLLRHDSVITAMKKMFHEYDDRVTEQYLLTFAALMGTFLGQKPFTNIPKFQKFIEEAKNHVIVTFGEKHPKYYVVSIGTGIAKTVEEGHIDGVSNIYV